MYVVNEAAHHVRMALPSHGPFEQFHYLIVDMTTLVPDHLQVTVSEHLGVDYLAAIASKYEDTGDFLEAAIALFLAGSASLTNTVESSGPLALDMIFRSQQHIFKIREELEGKHKSRVSCFGIHVAATLSRTGMEGVSKMSEALQLATSWYTDKDFVDMLKLTGLGIILPIGRVMPRLKWGYITETFDTLVQCYKESREIMKTQEGETGLARKCRFFNVLFASDLMAPLVMKADSTLTHDEMHGENGDASFSYVQSYSYAKDHKAMTSFAGYDVVLASPSICFPLEWIYGRIQDVDNVLAYSLKLLQRCAKLNNASDFLTLTMGIIIWPEYLIVSERTDLLAGFLAALDVQSFEDIDRLIAAKIASGAKVILPTEAEPGNSDSYAFSEKQFRWSMRQSYLMSGSATDAETQLIVAHCPEPEVLWAIAAENSNVTACKESVRANFSQMYLFGQVTQVQTAAMFEKLGLLERALRHLDFHDKIPEESGACQNVGTNQFGLRIRAKCLAKLGRIDEAAKVYKCALSEAVEKEYPLCEAFALRDYLLYAGTSLKSDLKVSTMLLLNSRIQALKASPERIERIFGKLYIPPAESEAAGFITKQKANWESHP